jgi:hypothetical protein
MDLTFILLKSVCTFCYFTYYVYLIAQCPGAELVQEWHSRNVCQAELNWIELLVMAYILVATQVEYSFYLQEPKDR